MSQNGTERKGFFLRFEHEEAISALSLEQQGKFFQACFAFHHGNEPDLSDPLVRILFLSIKPTFEKENRHYEEICEKRRQSGALGGRPAKANGFSEKQSKAKKANGFSEKQKKLIQEQEQEQEQELRKDSSLRSESSPEQSAVADTSGVVAIATPAEIILPLTGNREFGVTREDVREWSELYPAVDVMQELRAMRGWLLAHPRQQKTPSGIRRFCNSWLARSQDRAGSPRASPGQPAAPTEWQLQKQRQRLMAADLNRRRADEEREWANWTGWDKPTKSRDDDGIAIFSGAAIGENEHTIPGGH